MSKVKILFFALAMLLLSLPVFSQEAKYQSIFIYNFTRYIKWPEQMMADEFVIGVLGNSEVYKELKQMAVNKKQTQGLNLIIENYNSLSEIKKCHILFISKNKLKDLESVDQIPALSSTLIVTDSPGQALNGSTINFVEVEGRIKFELNQENANKRNLKVSTSLISLAIIV